MPNATRKIFLADDDDEDRMLFKEALQIVAHNVEVIEAENGIKLLELLENRHSYKRSIIVLDINMPLMNGFETIAAIKSTGCIKQLPIFFLSTSKNTNNITKAKQLGAKAYFIKPASWQDFLELVAKIVDQIT
ncbi:response regulator [Dyadobacter luteus]|uniref:Response regulator n=1 Tax=Dyadobacter luteus TaxID=2259619 RepID=A0A3D8Y9J0_9BACT|nr:response regulator [Dyadobacter luteus]REA60155.1 response regulator [Dyadobacter luteus]